MCKVIDISMVKSGQGIISQFLVDMASQLVGQGAMLEWSSYVRGHHVYCDVWTPAVGELLCLKNEAENSHYQFSVAVLKNDTVVGHIPRLASSLIFHFLSTGGHRGYCEVTGKRLNGGVNLGVEVPCVYRFYGGQRYIARLNSLLHDV